MCLVAVLFRAVPGAPVLIAANREEEYARGGGPPVRWTEPNAVVAGTDPQAGGTWLGVNVRGVLIAVTNRPKQTPPPNARSRGLLVRDLLAAPTAVAAVEQATRELATGRYAGCNVVCVDQERAAVIRAGEWLRVWLLPPGVHVLTNREMNDSSDERTSFARRWLNRDFADADEALAAMKALCGRTTDPAICLRGNTGGTVSSCLLDLRPELADSRMWTAEGPPDRSVYFDRTELLREWAT